MKFLFYLIVAIGVGVAYLLWRAKQVKSDVDAAASVAKEARNVFTGAPILQRTGESVLAAGSKPGSDVATMLYSLAALKRPVQAGDAAEIGAMLESSWRMSAVDREAALAFAAWAAANVGSAEKIMRGYLPGWRSSLDADRRQELVVLAKRTSALGGPPTDAQAAVLKRLGDGLLPG